MSEYERKGNNKIMNLQFDFIGPINDDNILDLRNCIANAPQPISNLTINISSLGGSVMSGITIYNYLKRQNFHISTHNIGEVSSAAILLYLAGCTRTSESISKFMIHPLSIGVNGDLPYHKVQELLRGIDADIKNYKAIVDRETNSMNGRYNVEQFLKSDSLMLDWKLAFECGIINQPNN